MKFLLIASFVALAAASAIYTTKVITMTSDGSFVLTASNGKSLLITRPMDLSGQRYIEIGLNGPAVPMKKIEITDASLVGQVPFGSKVYGDVEEELVMKKGQPSVELQGEVLFQILYQYQGTVVAPMYEELLWRIQKAVQEGLLTQHIWEIFAGIDQIDEVFAMVMGQLSGSGDMMMRGDKNLMMMMRGRSMMMGGESPMMMSGKSMMMESPMMMDRRSMMMAGNPMMMNRMLSGSSMMNRMMVPSYLRQQFYGMTGLNNQEFNTPYSKSWLNKYMMPMGGQMFNRDVFGSGMMARNMVPSVMGMPMMYNRMFNKVNGYGNQDMPMSFRYGQSVY